MAILTGTSGNDTRIGTTADDTIDGAGGNDLLFGTGGRDYLYAGLGNDTAWGGDERDWLYGGNGRDSLFGDALGDRLDGGNGDDRLSGGTGMDTAWGGAGNDQLWGGTGNDTLSGGTGNDSLDGGAGIDRARYAGPQDGYRYAANADGTVTVTDLDTANGDMGTDRLRGIEGIDFADGSATLALDDRLVTDEDAGRGGNAAFTFTAADLLANDLGDGLRLTAIDTSGLEGQLTWKTGADGSITDLAYTPTPDSVPSFRWRERTDDNRSYIQDVDPFQALAPGQTRSTGFTYTAVDAAGHEVSATVDLDVTGVNDLPTVLDLSIQWDLGIADTGVPFTFYAVDVDSDVFAFGLASLPESGFVDTHKFREEFFIDDPREPDYGEWVLPPSSPNPDIIWFESVGYDMTTERKNADYIGFRPNFEGFDSFTYVATDDRTLTTYSPAAVVTLEIHLPDHLY